MPVKAVKRGEKYRVVEKSSGNIAKTSRGNPRDGGGHSSKGKAERQARAMNQHR